MLRLLFAVQLCAVVSLPSGAALELHGRAEAVRGALQRVADRMAAKYNMSLAASFFSPAPELGDISVASGFTDGGLHLGASSRRARPDDVYVWGSTTKMFTAPAVLQLVERGVVALKDPIAIHIDPILLALNGTRLRDHFGGEIDEVHVEHLLHMTSGLADYDKGPFTADQFAHRGKAFGPIEIIGNYVTPGLKHTPGKRQSYSSTNYIMLGLLLARHGHKDGEPWSWQDYDQMSVIPDELRNAFSRSKFVMSGPCEDFTPVHGFMESYPGASLPEQDSWNVSCLGGWTAGNLIGPVSDVARFTYDLYSLHNPKIVPSKLQALLTNFSAPAMFPGFKFKLYGMGTFSLNWAVGDEQAYGHVGDTYGYQSQTMYFPSHDFVLSVATNVQTTSQAQPSDFACSALHEVLAALRGATAPSCTFKVFGHFVGKCTCSGGDEEEVVI